jgi:hypothetical protein
LLSELSAYTIQANTSCFRPFKQVIRFAWVLALFKAGSKTAISSAIIAITTSNSTNVKPAIFFFELVQVFINTLSLLAPSGVSFCSSCQAPASGGTITLYSQIYQITNPKTTVYFSTNTEIFAYPAAIYRTKSSPVREGETSPRAGPPQAESSAAFNLATTGFLGYKAVRQTLKAL